MNKFFAELPLDKQGNRSYTNSVPAVLEVAIPEGSLNARIVAPEFHTRFGYIPVDKLNTNWIEVPGPARVITEGEREALIIQQLRRPS